MKLLVQVAAFAFWVGSAHAQALNYTPFTVPPGVSLAGGPVLTGPVDLSRAYVSVAEYRTPVFATPEAFVGSGFVPVAAILSPAQDAVSQSLGSALVGIAARLDRLADRFSEGIALAGSINVLPPEPGRKINISVGGAGYNGAAAASIAVSARINENTIGYVGVAQGPTQTLVKGGFGWSPW